MAAIKSSLDLSVPLFILFFNINRRYNVSSRLSVRSTFGQETVNALNLATETSMPLHWEGVK